MPLPPISSAEPQPILQGLSARRFFLIAAILCTVGAAMLVWQTAAGSPSVRNAFAVAFVLAAAVFLGLRFWPAAAYARHAMLILGVTVTVLLGGLALSGGLGLRNTGLGFMALLVCLVSAREGASKAWALAAICACGVVGLWLAERQGLIDVAASVAAAPSTAALIGHLVLLAGGLMAGRALSQLIDRINDGARESERQMAALLDLAADRYFELDAELRFTVARNTLSNRMNELPPQRLGKHPWELLDVERGADSEALYAALRAHQPFNDRVEALRRSDGSMLYMSLSGRPRFNDDGEFIGYIGVGRDVTQLMQQQRALARARDEAEAANRAKGDFLANTSHEIRTPLNALVGLARLAREPGLEPARQQRYLEQIGDSAQSLSMIISDILDLSKIEAGKLEIESLSFDLHELLDSLYSAYAALADSRGLLFTHTIESDVPMQVHGDSVRLRQILANYLSNALKFTEHGSIRLLARRAVGEKLRFEVHDSGPGIDADAQARLFNPFTQADNTTTRRFGGTGLGLSICRQLAQLMGGEVGLLSQPGQGSCFWAELPLPEAEVGAAATDFSTLDADPLIGADVLLVEDNPVNMMISVAMLERWGAKVTQTTDGDEALRAVHEAWAEGRVFDLVLMDMQMPGKSGLDATRELRQHWSNAELPIVALTAAALVSERQAALEAGMNDFVTKPIDERRLRRTLVRTLQLREQPV